MNIGSVQGINIEQEMREAYLDYAMSVIVSRALPDARDGLKPVHRRILYAMYDMGLRADTPHRKSARIVGEVLGKYHPHGDAAVYEAMVRLAQDFSMRCPLVDGQGNFGSIDGDSAAAMRYTEARMASIGELLLVDIDKETVNFSDNFDGSLQEPNVLPSNLPNLLLNGSSGIAVGMSTSIPPHNLIELCQALNYILDKWEEIEHISVEQLMKFVKGPDFPTGGLVYRHIDGLKNDQDTLITSYATGRGKVTVRAKVYIEEIGRGKSQVIVTELPYQVNKSSLIERIANLVREEKLDGIADLRDESDRQGLRIVIELQRTAVANDVLAKLFKLTPLQDTFSINMLALVEGQPRILNLKQALIVFLNHRLEVVKRRSVFDLDKARARAHILEGLLTALNQLDKAIAIIRGSKQAEVARINLMEQLGVSEIQSQAILDMQLRRLAALEQERIEAEYQEKLALIAYLEGLLASPAQMRGVISKELQDISNTYGTPRRTIIIDSTATAVVRTEDFMIPEELTWITHTIDGKLARLLDPNPPRITTAMKTPPQFIVQTTTAQVLYLIAQNGQMATIPVQQLNPVQTLEEGVAYQDLCGLDTTHKLTALICLPMKIAQGYLFLATRSGEVKRLRVEDLPGFTSKIVTIMDIASDDGLADVFYSPGDAEVMLITAHGQSIRFSEDQVRPTGLPSGGMRGIKLAKNDFVVSAFAIRSPLPNLHVWNITNTGIAKVSQLDEYPSQGRAGQGVISMRLPTGSRQISAATVGKLDQNVVVLTSKGKAKYMRLGLAETVTRGKAGYGEPVIALKDHEEAIAVVNYQPIINPTT